MPNTHLCLVEDNQTLGKLTRDGLLSAGYTCTWYLDGSAIDWDIIETFDCFLLDVMLPGDDGYMIGKQIRKHLDTGIIYLTAKSTLDDKIQGFKSGADDYLAKPFAMQELVARIEAIIRRTTPPTTIILGDVSIDYSQRQVKKSGTTIHLTPIEWEVLGCLIDAQGQPCQRVELIEAGWGEDNLYTMSRSLDVTISNLRNKLGKDVIKTIPKFGYQLLITKD